MPKVSVVTPTYEHAAYARECVESVLAQTFEDWEMIVVDDGSSDGTPDVFESLGDERVTVIRQAHGGIGRLAETYNRALERAQGDYVAILEGDDLWPPEKLSVQVKDLEASGAVLSSGFTVMVEDGYRQDLSIPEIVPDVAGLANDPVGSAAAELLHPSHLTFTFPVSTVLRRSVLDRIGGFQSRRYLPVVDLPTFVRMASEGPFVWTNEVCGYWRRHGGSTTSGNLPRILDGAYRLAGEWLKETAPSLDVAPERLARLRDAWSAFMVHRAVMLSLELKGLGERKEALKAARLAASFGGPAKRRFKAMAAWACVELGVPEAAARKVTQTASSSSRLNKHESMIDAEMVSRVSPWER